MQENHFRRAIEEMHDEDMSLRYEGGYVSGRTWMLALNAQMVLASESPPDMYVEYDEGRKAA